MTIIDLSDAIHHIGQQQAEEEVNEPVMHVAVRSEPRLQDPPEWNLRVGVVGADDMHHHEDGDQGECPRQTRPAHPTAGSVSI